MLSACLLVGADKTNKIKPVLHCLELATSHIISQIISLRPNNNDSNFNLNKISKN